MTIPKNLYTHWHEELPPMMKKNYEWMKKENPEIKFHLYNEKKSRDFIKKHFDKEVVDAYDSLIPYAYKSDLWRYCILYVNGGIYLDIKYKCVNGFKLCYLTKETFVKDRPDGCVYNALLVTKPKNKIMLKCIEQIVSNVKNRYYGPGALYPTGPGLLGSFFGKKIEQLELSFIGFEKINKDLCGIIIDDYFILTYYEGYRKEQSKYKNLKYYSDLWIERNIYATL